MTDKETMKLALDALEANQPINYCMNNNGEKFPMFSNDPLRQERNEKAITALKERLAQPEPIQSLQCFHCQVTIETLNDKVMHLMTQRKPLTPAEIAAFVGTHGFGPEQLKWFRYAEAAHGIKENT